MQPNTRDLHPSVGDVWKIRGCHWRVHHVHPTDQVVGLAEHGKPGVPNTMRMPVSALMVEGWLVERQA